jgi:hypothetical protein
MRGPRRIPAHAVDGAPNLGRKMIDTFLHGSSCPILTAASECTWLIGKQEQQCSGHDWRKPVCVTHPHAHTRSRVNDLAKCSCEAKIIRNANGRHRQCGAHQFDQLPRLRRQFRVKGRRGRHADSTAGIPPASEITPPFRHLRFGHNSGSLARRIVMVARRPCRYKWRMPRVIFSAIIFLGFMVGSAIVTPPRLVAAATEDDTHREMCNVVQATFMALTSAGDLAYPKDVVPSSQPTVVSENFFAPELGADERADLMSRRGKYSIEHFAPVCDWKGSPQPVVIGGDHMSVEFSNPIFFF